MQAHDGTAARWIRVLDGEEFEALQPLESGLRDYAARIRDVLRILSVVEGRSELDILADISNVSMDVHSVRCFPAECGPGMISLEDGVRAFESLRSLVLAAACSVSAQRQQAVQPPSKPTEVLDLIRSVRIGPSREGSFILSVHTPIPPRLTSGQSSLFDLEEGIGYEPAEPFERRVSLRIYDAAQAAQRAANSALVDPNGLDAFTEAVPDGVSANLCEALAGLGGERQHPFELSLSFAASRPVTRRMPPVRFRHDHLPVLMAAAQELRARIPDQGVLVTGNVVRLYREGGGAGEISIAGTLDGEDDERLRRVWTKLAAPDYDAATRAHRDMLPVSVRGDLVRRGTRLYMSNPTAFRVLTAED
jgi:hypothetical protein